MRQNPAGCIFRGSEKVSIAETRPASANGVQQRIDRLENLVTSLIAQTRDQAKADSPPEEQEILKASPWENGSVEGLVTEGIPTEVQHEMGFMTVENGGLNSKYRGTTHWCDVLKEVSSQALHFFRQKIFQVSWNNIPSRSNHHDLPVSLMVDFALVE